MQTIEQIRAAGMPCFPCRADKSPLVVKGQSWHLAAKTPLEYLRPSDIGGLPIPRGLVVIDLDLYKGVTRQAVDAALGGPLPWDLSLVQSTPSGGEHHAFRVDWPVRQASDIGGISGLDTRVSGHGYICFGRGYTPANMFGLLRMSDPICLPEMPEHTRTALERPRPPRSKAPDMPAQELGTDQLKTALNYISPHCSRTKWLEIGLALKHHFQDDCENGFTVFDNWSRGDFCDYGEPENYTENNQQSQWDSFKVEGGITVATLYYRASKYGWSPPIGFDSGAVFGKGAAPVDRFNDLLSRVISDAGNSSNTQLLVDAIIGLPCSRMQRATLKAELIRGLKDAGLLTREMRSLLDAAPSQRPKAPTDEARVATLPTVIDVANIPSTRIQGATGAHGINALHALQQIFGDRLAIIGGLPRWWSGVEWQRVPDAVLDRHLFLGLMPDHSKAPNIRGTKTALLALAPEYDVPPPCNRIFFRNGVFDPATGIMYDHNRNNLNCGSLTIDYDQNARAKEWQSFLRSIFGHAEDGQAREALLQEVLGWCLISHRLGIQKCVAFDGVRRGGKGVTLEVLTAIIGPEMCGTANFSGLGNAKIQSAFRGRNVVIDSEAKSPPTIERAQAVAFFNKMTSNETVTIPVLFKTDPWSGRLNSKFIFSCNGIPHLSDDSAATVDRTIALVFDKSFADNPDYWLLERLLPELGGVAAWAVQGLRRLIQNDGKFTLPSSSIQAAENLNESSQPLREFIDNNLIYEEGEKCHQSDIWAIYGRYAIEAHINKMSRNRFYAALRQTLLGTATRYAKSVECGGKVSRGYHGIHINHQQKE